jgi:hypothetical protein
MAWLHSFLQDLSYQLYVTGMSLLAPLTLTHLRLGHLPLVPWEQLAVALPRPLTQADSLVALHPLPELLPLFLLYPELQQVFVASHVAGEARSLDP